MKRIILVWGVLCGLLSGCAGAPMPSQNYPEMPMAQARPTSDADLQPKTANEQTIEEDMAEQRYNDCIHEKEERKAHIKQYLRSVEDTIAKSNVTDPRTLDDYRGYYSKYAGYYASTCKRYPLPAIRPLARYIECYNKLYSGADSELWVKTHAAAGGYPAVNEGRAERSAIAQCIQNGRAAADCYRLHHRVSAGNQDRGPIANNDPREMYACGLYVNAPTEGPRTCETRADFSDEVRGRPCKRLIDEASRAEDEALERPTTVRAAPHWTPQIVPERAVNGVQ